jgi:hypothetical protein
VALIHSMRLSLMKGAHADLSSTAWQEIGVKPAFGLEWDTTTLDTPFLSSRGAVDAPMAFSAFLLAAKPCPLDGCPMFADFRVHGLNKTFFQCFHHRSTPTCRKKKKEGLRLSSSTHVRESPRTWGTRPGGKADEQATDCRTRRLGRQAACSLGAVGLPVAS